MEWFIAVVIVAALGVAAVAAAGGLGGMAKEPVRDVYRQDLPDDRRLVAGDINALRFGTALRGYAMDQVDDILDRLAREIGQRDELIARLQAGQSDAAAPEVVHPAMTQPEMAQPTIPQPEMPQPAMAQPVTAQPAVDPEPAGVAQPADEVSPDYR